MSLWSLKVKGLEVLGLGVIKISFQQLGNNQAKIYQRCDN